ncbi:MAG: stage V sporulation protein AC [Clostridia bacterium]|nr:stage V sporulation protein AC [Clostridia bacterium]MBR2943745.1 stage V sporulation protein AC [Clostridia bacterium]
MNEKEYGEYVEKRAKKSPIIKNCVFAFLIGGAICTLGQGFFHLYTHFGMEETDARTLVSITLIFLASLLTGLGVFDNIARIAGAGTLVPITGFSNAVSSQAIDTKSEGYILGVGAKIFTIAGPVILYGTVSGAIYGVIYYFACLIWGAK